VLLETGLGVIQGHLKWHHLINHIRLLVSLPYCMSCTVFELFEVEEYRYLEIYSLGVTRPAHLCTICTSLNSSLVTCSYLLPLVVLVYIHPLLHS